MQKFKAMRIAARNAAVAADPSTDAVRRFNQTYAACADRYGRFVYGGHRTMTQATRWRIAAFREMATGCHARVQSLLDSAWRGGCRLP